MLARLCFIFGLAFCLPALNGCGQTGPLMMPDEVLEEIDD